jgi:chromosome segregation ATPase
VTTLYLQRIQISNFRAYGDNFSLSLPGPGVTILAGPPGPGKSAFFEAVEWALTGRVHRLEALSQESLEPRRRNGLLARRGEDGPVAQYSVSLEFMSGEGEGHRIERRAAREQEDRELFAEVSSPTQQQVVDLLRASSGLDEISDIGEYLRRTHLGGPLVTQLSAARTKIAQGLAQKSALAARIDRATHELWMVQSFLSDDHRAQLQSLNGYHAELQERIEQLSSEITSDTALIAQVEQDILDARALPQQPELPGWSRWPALLLDDPLQPQDLIPPEAFIEALRSLVRDRKYQVILSTHDEALTEEMRRKLVEAGIPCVTCRYRDLGPTGVLYSTD